MKVFTNFDLLRGIAPLIITFGILIFSPITLSQQQQELPLLSISALEYKGGFRLPEGQFGDNELSTHSYSTGPIAFNPANNSLFTVSHDRQQGIGEFLIPTIIPSDDPNDFETASVLQNFRDFHQDGSALTGTGNYFRITGLALANSKLVVNYINWYDAAGTETDTSVVFQTPIDLANSAVVGPFQLDGAAHTAGWLTPIPNQWQAALGGDYVAGHSHGSIISRLSVGPPAHALNIDGLTDATQGAAVATTALLDFSLSEPLYDTNTYDLADDSVNDILYNKDKQNNLWTIISGASYGFIVPNTGTYLTLGYAGGFNSGVGYKITQTDGNVCGGPCSYDPKDNYNHFWLWKVSDMVNVKNGILQPSELRPYAYGQLNTRGNSARVKGATYDYANKRLYISLQRGDPIPTYARPPLILVYNVDEGRRASVVLPPFDLLLNK